MAFAESHWKTGNKKSGLATKDVICHKWRGRERASERAR